MFVYKKNPVGIELFSHVKTFFYSKQFAKLLTTWLKTIYRNFRSANPNMSSFDYKNRYYTWTKKVEGRVEN